MDFSSNSKSGTAMLLIVTIKDHEGALEQLLKIFRLHGIRSLTHIESRPSKTIKWTYDFCFEFVASPDSTLIEALISKLQAETGFPVQKIVHQEKAKEIMTSRAQYGPIAADSLSLAKDINDNHKRENSSSCNDTDIPWFPRKLSDLDSFADKTLQFGGDEGELSADHPGFTDPIYRKRRAEIARIARTYRT